MQQSVRHQQKYRRNKAPRRKQRGIKSALQTVGFQPAFAPRGEELNPEEIKDGFRLMILFQQMVKFEQCHFIRYPSSIQINASKAANCASAGKVSSMPSTIKRTLVDNIIVQHSPYQQTNDQV